ncbi:MAG: NAD(P)H-quinone oxidoreductase [Acidobacteria bacterium]|nr:NAD(P)H-quinone oxidoreductase [Acidobacteriota bacterium]
MRCVEIATFGPPEGMRLVERPDPVAGPGEVLIDVDAAGVNRPDVIQRYGRYPPPPGASDVPGLEVAGRVLAAGAGVQRWRAGDPVCALVSGGGYAERCVAPEAQCLPVPAGLSMTEAAALPETFFTVWTNVFQRGRLSTGEWLLLHGGTSGIGTTAIQLAVVRGAHVAATAGSDEKCVACRRLGAAHAWNYRTTDWVETMREATGGRGADVVLDMVGGDYTARNLDALATEGRLVQIAFLKSSRVELDLMLVMRRRLWITGSTLRPRTPAEKGAIARELEAQVWPLLGTRRIAPVIDTVFPLAAVADAHRRMEAGAHVGKLVLDVRA